jgi:hypothetical protein
MVRPGISGGGLHPIHGQKFVLIEQVMNLKRLRKLARFFQINLRANLYPT